MIYVHDLGDHPPPRNTASGGHACASRMYAYLAKHARRTGYYGAGYIQHASPARQHVCIVGHVDERSKQAHAEMTRPLRRPTLVIYARL